MKVVISLGGSTIVPDELDVGYVREFAELARKLSSKHQLAVVTGGGRLARKYIQAADSFNVTDEAKDWIGISATHLNAILVASGISNAVYKREFNLNDVKEGKVVVTGGTTPGHSTDAVAAEIAVQMKADLLVNASNIKGVYEEDPDVNPKAKLIEKISAGELLAMVSQLPQTPGKYALMDKQAVETIKENKIKTIILGSDTGNMENAIQGKKFVGTTVE